MTRTPEEIKKGLECALCDEPADICGVDCPCWSAYSPAEMRQDEHVADALSYIQQLEAENERLQRYYEAEADRAADAHHNMLEAEDSVPRWTSVEDEYPDAKLAVLGYGLRSKRYGEEDPFPSVHVVYTRGEDEGWFTYFDNKYVKVTHWMPMPEPPEVTKP